MERFVTAEAKKYNGTPAIPPYGTVDLLCPFCGDADFDIIGLKNHIARGWCDAFNQTPTE